MRALTFSSCCFAMMTASRSVEPASTTRITPSIRDERMDASATLFTGGVSKSTVSYIEDTSSMNLFILSEPKISAGFGGTGPLVMTCSVSTFVGFITVSRGRFSARKFDSPMWFSNR